MFWLDHAVVAFLALAVPLWALADYRRLKRRIAEGDAGARLRAYRQTVAEQWIFALGLVALWFWLGRSAGELGLALRADLANLAGLGLTVAVLGFLWMQWRAIGTATPEQMQGLRGQMAGIDDLVPHNEAEGRLFRVVALTAGICEEIVYRGYLIWYFGQMLEGWIAVLISTLIFGLGHAYQGPANGLKAGAVGLALGFLYLLTGSLLWPILIHATIDLQGGAISRRVFGGEAKTGPEAGPARS